jgi:imidazole glycerol-phosphate synthase subunit HisH
MTPGNGRPVAIIDYGLGNLHNVRRACEAVGLRAKITVSPEDLLSSAAAILPGVGAFGDAMSTLNSSGLGPALRELAHAGKPLFGICLGFQLLMTESYEFGHHQGLDILPGSVVRFDHPQDEGGPLKVPHVGWNRVWKAKLKAGGAARETLLDNVADGEYMYFVHSFVVVPAQTDAIISTTHYGDVEFCSSAGRGNVFGCQYHPERSGVEGLKIYARWARTLQQLSQSTAMASGQ